MGLSSLQLLQTLILLLDEKLQARKFLCSHHNPQVTVVERVSLRRHKSATEALQCRTPTTAGKKEAAICIS